MPRSQSSYHPQPVDLDHMELPAELAPLRENLAEHVHELWAAARMEEGWRYANKIDRSRKKHPGMVPYSELPEDEKEIDRGTAEGTLRFILAAGFSIARETSPAGADQGRCCELAELCLRELDADPPLHSTDLLERWHQAPVAESGHEVQLYRKFACLALRLSDLEMCAMIASAGLSHHRRDPHLVGTLAIAMLQEGRRSDSRQLLQPAIEHAQKVGAPPGERVELLARLARTYKDEWSATGDAAALEEAASLYRQACDLDPADYYPAINLATLLFLGGRTGDARKIARKVIRLLDGAEPTYWGLATRAEASLVLGNIDDTRKSLRLAGRADDATWRDRGATASQIQLLLGHLGRRMPSLDRLLRLPKVCVLQATGEPPSSFLEAGPAKGLRVDPALPEGAKLAVVGVESLAQVEALAPVLKKFEEYHLILPCPVDSLLEGAFRSPLRGVLEELCQGASSIRPTCSQLPVDWSLSVSYLRAIARGTAMLMADRLGLSCQIIRITGSSLPPVRAHEAADGPPAFEPLGRLRIGTMQQDIKALLFADVHGYSNQPEVHLREFLRSLLGDVSRLVSGAANPPVFMNTWGDALFMVFDDVLDAAQFALELEKLLAGNASSKSAAPVSIRTSLHAGPVFSFCDPVTRQIGFTGIHVNHAARLEPLVEPGEVWTSQAFAALASQSDSTRFRFHYVGTRWGKHNYGPVDLYRLTSNG